MRGKRRHGVPYPKAARYPGIRRSCVAGRRPRYEVGDLATPAAGHPRERGDLGSAQRQRSLATEMGIPLHGRSWWLAAPYNASGCPYHRIASRSALPIIDPGSAPAGGLPDESGQVVRDDLTDLFPSTLTRYEPRDESGCLGEQAGPNRKRQPRYRGCRRSVCKKPGPDQYRCCRAERRAFRFALWRSRRRFSEGFMYDIL